MLPRTRLSIVAALVALIVPASAAAHDNQYAFQREDVRVHRARLTYTFNNLFPDFAPHEIRCRGLRPIRFGDGSRGFIHIRCTVPSMSVPDFIYHLNRFGEELVTRKWP